MKNLTELSAKLDGIITFQYPTEDQIRAAKERGEQIGATHRGAITAGIGSVGAAGAAGYGLYKRGQAVGDFTWPFSKGPRGSSSARGVISTPKSRGIMGNIAIGAGAIPGDVSTGAQRLAQRASILSHPMARAAAIHDIRAGLAGRLGKLVKNIKPPKI